MVTACAVDQDGDSKEAVAASSGFSSGRPAASRHVRHGETADRGVPGAECSNVFGSRRFDKWAMNGAVAWRSRSCG
jgi:hypothetical protein